MEESLAMKPVNVLIVSAISEECKRQIAAVSPRINLVDGTPLWKATHIVVEGSKGDAVDERFESLLAEAEVIYGRRPPSNIVRRAPKLKWFQSMLAGVDHFLDDDLARSRVTLTNMSGIHDSMVGETALGMMLMFAKRAPFSFENKQAKIWSRFDPMILDGKTAGIIGLGNIGKNIARLCKAFKMTVLATRRSAREGDRARNVDKVFPASRLIELLRESDFVVMVLPATRETFRLVGEQELRAMKPTACFLNLGRGNTVDEAALIRALSEGWIAGAGLDAYEVEPLPLDNKLWDLPNVILSPHVSGKAEGYDFIVNRIFCENLKRYLSGKRMRNVVNKKRGY